MRGFDFLSEFDERVLRTIRKFNMICSGDCIVVAVSGGPDSMSLLRALIKLREKFNIKLVVAHVNHMIRAVADSETEFVKGFCEDNDVECFVKKVDVVGLSEKLKISCEEAGRNVRYDFFDEIFDKVGANKIAIAHNKNDNAETVLMNIMRGSGVSGLKGIEPIRNGKFIRPLIEIDRKSIEQYCVDENLNPKFDESNKENVYTRNKVRNLLIPYIEKEFNPNIIESISRLSDLATQESNFVDNSPPVRFGMDRPCAEDDNGKAGYGDIFRFGRNGCGSRRNGQGRFDSEGCAFGCRLASPTEGEAEGVQTRS